MPELRGSGGIPDAVSASQALVRRSHRQSRLWGLVLLGVIAAIGTTGIVGYEVPQSIRFVIGGIGILALILFSFWAGLAACYWLRSRATH
jgi:hypothetical protein